MSATRLAGEARHPIRVVAARTGLTPDVLRAWERRYGAVQPGRTAGGQRLYSDADLERLLLLARATAAGRQIGLVADLDVAELAALIAEDERLAGAGRAGSAASAAERGEVVDAAMESVSALDAAGLQSGLRTAVMELGAGRFVSEVVLPLLHRVGDAWHAGRITPAHEHMASALIRETLSRLLTESMPSGGRLPVLVVATLAGERHELGAMAAAAAAARAGWRVLYLGPDLPASSIAEAAKQAGARAVAIGVVSPVDAHMQERELRQLADALGPGVEVFMGGPGAPLLSAPPGGRVRREGDLVSFVSALGALQGASPEG